VFYTPGWGVVLTVTGTLGGVIITQAANSWSTRGARRKERNDRINDSVGDLIAFGNAWVYAVGACEQTTYDAIRRDLDVDERVDKVTAARADVRSAELAYGRALARVRLTCLPSILAAAEDYNKALIVLNREAMMKVDVVQETRNLNINERCPRGIWKASELQRAFSALFAVIVV
jgi:hypothetical protein